MARPIRNNVDYFPHTCKHGKGMHFIESQYGNDGYATWFKILEEMGNADNHYLNLNDDIMILFLSSRCHIEEGKLLDIINSLVRLGEFDKSFWNHKILVGVKFLESVTDAYRKRSNDIITLPLLAELLQLDIVFGQNSAINTQVAEFTAEQSAVYPQSKEEKSKEEERIGEKTKLYMSELSVSDELLDYENIALSFWELAKNSMSELNINSTDLKNAKIKNWIDPVRLSIEKDKRTNEEFREIFQFLKKEKPSLNGFSWKSNIRSGRSLREKFEKLLIAARKSTASNDGMDEYKQELIKRAQQ